MRKLEQDVMDLPIVERASTVAAMAHEGQYRKYTGEPYFNHCHNVAREVESRGYNEYMVAAAYLHDTIEDTDVTAQWLRVYFPPATVDLVIGLTDVYTHEAFPHLNRAQRKELECERYRGECEDVQRIKLCDLVDNTKSIVKHDPGFAMLYLREKSDLLACFTDTVLCNG